MAIGTNVVKCAVNIPPFSLGAPRQSSSLLLNKERYEYCNNKATRSDQQGMIAFRPEQTGSLTDDSDSLPRKKRGTKEEVWERIGDPGSAPPSVLVPAAPPVSHPLFSLHTYLCFQRAT